MMIKLIFILLISLCAAETETLADPYLADQLIITPHFKDQLLGVNLLLETYLIDKASPFKYLKTFYIHTYSSQSNHMIYITHLCISTVYIVRFFSKLIVLLHS
jgi:hypothetical protein